MSNSTEISRLISHFGGQKATADAVGVQQPTVFNWLNGKHGISPVKALKIEAVTEGEFQAKVLCPALADFD